MYVQNYELQKSVLDTKSKQIKKGTILICGAVAIQFILQWDGQMTSFLFKNLILHAEGPTRRGRKVESRKPKTKKYSWWKYTSKYGMGKAGT